MTPMIGYQQQERQGNLHLRALAIEIYRVTLKVEMPLKKYL